MANENLKIDANDRNTLGAITNDANAYIKNIRVNPITGAVLVEANVTSSNTMIGSTIPGGTAGSVLFLDVGSTLAQDNSYFFYNPTTHELALGHNSPSATLDVVGTLQYVDGNQASGFVLTSDASGNGTWQVSTTGLQDPGSNGIVVRTALNTTVPRTLQGTSARITVINGTGVLGDPTVDIASNYVGQNTITTLGTITTGVWSGTTISIAKGGTGATTSNTAFNALAPSQTSNSGKFLTTNGTDTSWATISGTGSVTSVDGSGGSTGLTLTGGPITTSGTLTLGGTLAVGSGGTGISSYTQGDLVYASAATTFTKLAKDTNATRYLSNTGTTNNPAWAQVNLTNGVTGTLPVGNGGTGATSFTAHGVLIGNTTSAVASTGAGTTGQVLTSNGASADPTFQAVPNTNIGYSTGVGSHSASAGSFNVTHGLGATPKIIIFNILGGTRANLDVSEGTYLISSGTQQCIYADNAGPKTDGTNIYHIDTGASSSNGQITSVGGTTFTVSTGNDALAYTYSWQVYA